MADDEKKGRPWKLMGLYVVVAAATGLTGYFGGTNDFLGTGERAASWIWAVGFGLHAVELFFLNKSFKIPIPYMRWIPIWVGILAIASGGTWLAYAF